MVRAMILGVVAAGLAFLAGCADVKTATPLATASHAESAEKLRGAWSINDGVLSVEVDEKCVLHAAYLEWSGEPKRFVLREGRAIVVSTPSGMLLSFHDGNGKDGNEKGWGLMHLVLSNSDRDLIAGEASKSWFSKAIQRGELKGDAAGSKDSSITLRSSSEEIIAAIVKAIERDEAPFRRYEVARKIGGKSE